MKREDQIKVGASKVGKGLGYEGNFQKVAYPQQMSCEVDIKPDWEQPVCQAGVPALEVKSAEPHPVEVHPHLSPHGAMRLCGPCFLVLE